MTRIEVQLEEGDGVRINESFYKIKEIRHEPDSGKEFVLDYTSGQRILTEEEFTSFLCNSKLVKIVRSKGDTVTSYGFIG